MYKTSNNYECSQREKSKVRYLVYFLYVADTLKRMKASLVYGQPRTDSVRVTTYKYCFP